MSYELDYNTANLIVNILVAAGTIGLAILAYLQMSSLSFNYKRNIARDLAAKIVCVLVYLENRFGLSHPLLENTNIYKCIPGVSISLNDMNIEYYVSDVLEEQIKLLSEILNDKSIRNKINSLSILGQLLKEAKHKYEPTKSIIKYHEDLIDILKTLMKKYKLSIAEVT